MILKTVDSHMAKRIVFTLAALVCWLGGAAVIDFTPMPIQLMGWVMISVWGFLFGTAPWWWNHDPVDLFRSLDD